MSQTIPQLQRLLGRMQEFSKPRMVAGQKFGTIRGSDVEH